MWTQIRHLPIQCLFGQIITFLLIIKVTILLWDFCTPVFATMHTLLKSVDLSFFLLNKGKVNVLSGGVKHTLMSLQKCHLDGKLPFFFMQYFSQLRRVLHL